MGRTEKSLKNIAFGIGAQMVTTLMTFISRTVMLNCLGLEVVSLNGLFKEVIMDLSLAELGIGSAIVYNLYKPLAEKDTEKVCQLMTFFKNAYRVIAVAIFLLGTIVCFFVPLLVKDINYSDSYMRIVFMLFVVNISCSYLFSYKVSLLNADQNSYIHSYYSTILGIITVVVQVVVMALSRNFIVYLVVCIGLTLGNNWFISSRIDKRYTYLRKAPLPKEEKKGIFGNVKNIFIKELSGKITSSTDSILISTIISTIMVGKYSFYATILGVIKQFINHIDVGMRASLGNLFATGEDEKCSSVLYRLTWGYCALGVFCCTCFYSCCQSFISFWVGEEYLLGKYVVMILAVNLFCYMCSKPIYAAMHVAGFFEEGRNISIIGSVVNLVVSVVFAFHTGIFGIFLGTFCTYFIQIVMKVYYVYKLKFKSSGWKYFAYLLKFIVILGILVFGCDYLCHYINTSIHFVDFLLKGMLSAVISLVVLFLCYCRCEEFVYFKGLLGGYLKKFKK